MINFLKSIFRISFIFKTITVFSILALVFSYLSPYVHPKTIWFIPFFGLAYPIIILFNILLLIIWAFARSKWFFVVLVFIIFGGGLHFRFYSSPFGKNKIQNEKSIKILSYNVQNFDVYNVGFNKDFSNRDSIFAYLGREQADIVCFQEFYSQDEKQKFPTKDTLHAILKAEFFHDRMSFNRHFKNYWGVSMYSKYPMITKGYINFDDSSTTTNNFCIFADIVKHKDTFRIYNTHFQSIKFQTDDYKLFGDSVYTGVEKSNVRKMLEKLHFAYQSRANQALKVFEHMEQSPYPVLLCGDFNDTPLSYVYNIFYSKFIDAFRNSSSGIGKTYAGKVPAGRIDYIFHSKSVESSNFMIQNQIFSDHKAISCEFWKN
jgi:endonuclease/exonuclease/phosphatase family metal-dependent hydrolase